MDSGKYLVYSLNLSEGCPAGGEWKWTDPGVFFVKKRCSTAKKDGLIVAGGSHKYCGGFLQVFSPAYQEILNVLLNDYMCVSV